MGGVRDGDAGKHLKPAAKRLGLPGVTWHLLRHSHATMLDFVDAPLRTMQSLLGHSTPEITREIYLHAIPEEQRRAVESVERLVFRPKWTQVQAPTQTAPARVNELKKQELLVGAIGFEPTTPCAQGRCATRLRYTPLNCAPTSSEDRHLQVTKPCFQIKQPPSARRS